MTLWKAFLKKIYFLYNFKQIILHIIILIKYSIFVHQNHPQNKRHANFFKKNRARALYLAPLRQYDVDHIADKLSIAG